MRTKFLRQLLLLQALCALLVLFLVGPAAQAQVTATTLVTLTNLPSIVAGSATSNLVGNVIYVRQGEGLAVMPYFAGTNASTANVIVNFVGSVDGDNYSTTYIAVTNAMNGTTAVRGFSPIVADRLIGLRTIKPVSIVNAHTASLFVTNIVVSRRN